MNRRPARSEVEQVHLVDAQSAVSGGEELPIDAGHRALVERASEVLLEVRAHGGLTQLDTDHLVSLIVQPARERLKTIRSGSGDLMPNFH